jgi:DNA-binding CsgD family transcriptional regulator
MVRESGRYRQADVVDSELLAIIGLIYDAVIDPTGWEPALEAIRVRHGWHNAVLSVFSVPLNQNTINVAINLPASFFEIAPRYIKEVGELWGGAAKLAQFPLEEPIFNTNASDSSRWMENAYFREWGYPEGMLDQVAIALVRDHSALANVSFGIHKTTVVKSGAIEELRLLAPHLRRAATITRILENSLARAATFEAALDATQAGAVLVRDDMQIVHANAAADAMLSGEDPIRSSQGRLKLRGELVPGQLEAAVLAAGEGAAAIGRKGIGIPARRGDGTPLVTHVMPLEARHGEKLEADAVVFVAESGGAEPLATQSLELLYGLTPAEARAFELVAAGQSSRDIASAMGVAPSTLHTHLLRVYDKTGRHSRTGLMQLARELKLPG